MWPRRKRKKKSKDEEKPLQKGNRLDRECGLFESAEQNQSGHGDLMTALNDFRDVLCIDHEKEDEERQV